MALLLNEKPGLIDETNVIMDDMEFSEIDAVLLMSILEESNCEEFCNEEQVNSLMESLEAEIRMAEYDSCNVAEMVKEDGFDCFEWTDMESVPSSPTDDMNWYAADQLQEMDVLIELMSDSPHSYCEVSLDHAYGTLWQETYDTTITH